MSFIPSYHAFCGQDIFQPIEILLVLFRHKGHEGQVQLLFRDLNVRGENGSVFADCFETD